MPKAQAWNNGNSVHLRFCRSACPSERCHNNAFDRYPITIDLTTNKIYSVSNDTEDYVKKVNVDVQVTIFADENTYTNYSSYNKQAVELLKTIVSSITISHIVSLISTHTLRSLRSIPILSASSI